MPKSAATTGCFDLRKDANKESTDDIIKLKKAADETLSPDSTERSTRSTEKSLSKADLS